MFVAANPQVYADSFWAVNYLHVYTSLPGTPPPPPTGLSSAVPAINTKSDVLSDAVRTSNTHSGTPGPSKGY